MTSVRVMFFVEMFILLHRILLIGLARIWVERRRSDIMGMAYIRPFPGWDYGKVGVSSSLF